MTAAPVALNEASKPPPLAQSASTSNFELKAPVASTSKKTVRVERQGFLGISDARTWRPKLFERNPNYPRVTSPGCFFLEHSGGFQLIHRLTKKCLGFYTRAQTKELEKKYGKKKSRNRKRA